MSPVTNIGLPDGGMNDIIKAPGLWPAQSNLISQPGRRSLYHPEPGSWPGSPTTRSAVDKKLLRSASSKMGSMATPFLKASSMSDHWIFNESRSIISAESKVG